VITIATVEREYGSGAPTVAKALAARLGWTLWDNQITCEVAQLLKCDVASVERREERLDPAFYRLAKIFMRGSYEESFTGGGPELLDAEHLSRLFEKVVKKIASNGRCVIVGRGAPWFLRGRRDVFHLFLYASTEEKVRRITALGKSREEAEHLIATVDQERAAFIRKFYGRVWPQRDLYHLMLNAKLGDDAMVDLALQTIAILDKQSAPAG